MIFIYKLYFMGENIHPLEGGLKKKYFITENMEEIVFKKNDLNKFISFCVFLDFIRCQSF